MTPPPPPVSDAIIKTVITLLGTPDIEEDRIEREVRALVPDDMTARRLIDWIPEAFGMVLASDPRWKIIPPRYFQVRFASKKFVSLRLETEPVFLPAFQEARRLYKENPDGVFLQVACRGSIAQSVFQGLKSGASLEGSVMSGPVLLGIPAEIYRIDAPFWKRWFL